MKNNVLFIALLLAPYSVIFSGNAASQLSAPPPSTPTVTVEAVDETPADQHITVPISTDAVAAAHPGAPTVVVNVHNEPKFANQNVNTNNNNLYAHAQAAAQATAKAASELYAKFYTRIEPHIERAKQTDFVALLERNKKNIFWGLIAALYGGISAQLIRDRQYLSGPERWANWKQHMTAQEMQTSPQLDLQKDLTETILNRYLAKHANRLACYIQFVKDVEQEERRIARHLLISKWVRLSYLMRIFPINNATIRRARIKQKRLAFVKHIFISWAATQSSLKGGIHEAINV